MEPKLMRVTCPECGWVGHYTIEDLEKTLKKAKIDKAIVVANQLHRKSGPFYDRWLVAMEARGEQKRCKDCHWMSFDRRCRWRTFAGQRVIFVKPGQFACKGFQQR